MCLPGLLAHTYIFVIKIENSQKIRTHIGSFCVSVIVCCLFDLSHVICYLATSTEMCCMISTRRKKIPEKLKQKKVKTFHSLNFTIGIRNFTDT